MEGQPFSGAAHCRQQAGPYGRATGVVVVATPLTQKSAWTGKEQPKAAAPPVGILQTRSIQHTRRVRLGICLERSSFLATGIQQIQTLSASEMICVPPFDCDRVKLARVLIKMCQHLKWGPETCRISCLHRYPMHISPLLCIVSILCLGEGRTSPSQLGSPGGRGADWPDLLVLEGRV